LICLRLSRTNHACVSNSDISDYSHLKVLILFSEKDIKAGDEITTSYITHRDFRLFINQQAIETRLIFTGGIICPTGILS
jgi:SET domain-containing protein